MGRDVQSVVDGRRFPSYEHVEHETLHWIGFYGERRHEEVGDLPPDGTVLRSTRYKSSGLSSVVQRCGYSAGVMFE